MTTPKVARTERARGFTVVEILIIVIVLAILSGVVIPQFTSASRQSGDATLKDCLRYLRAQIQAYKSQHHDVAPGYPTDDATQNPDATTFVAQMTQYTDDGGQVSGSPSGACRFGPYLNDMPANPISSQNGILVVNGATLPAPDRSQPYGWMYCPQTQQIVANLSGCDQNGLPFTSY